MNNKINQLLDVTLENNKIVAETLKSLFNTDKLLLEKIEVACAERNMAIADLTVEINELEKRLIVLERKVLDD